MINVSGKAVLKLIGKIGLPVVSGILTVKSELESQALKNTVTNLVERVSTLEKK